MRALIRRTVKSAVVEPLESRAYLAADTGLLSVPVLDSRSTSFKQLYLDFDGEAPMDWAGLRVTQTPAYSSDADATSFSAEELEEIRNIWQGVSDRFAPFDINVTTVRPASFDNGVALHMVVGGKSTWWPGGSIGGVALLDSFVSELPNVAFTFPLIQNGTTNTANLIAHEAGHAFGLHHRSDFAPDGSLDEEYSNGNGFVNFIMGYPGSGRSLWSSGSRVQGVSYLQDDVQILRSVLGISPDAEGDSPDTATVLTREGNTLSSGVGYVRTLQSPDDLDWYTFDTQGGAIDLRIFGPNDGMLDPAVELQDAAGNVIASLSDQRPAYAEPGRRLRVALSAGKYYLRVGSTGEYGSMGSYSITGLDGLKATNISAGRTFTASGVSNGRIAARAGDENRLTYWQSGASPGQWISVDLGTSSTINSIDYSWVEAYGAVRYRIQVSSNGSQWTDVFDQAGFSYESGEKTVEGLNAVGRYVRLICTAAGGDYGIGLYNFDVYGFGNQTPPPVQPPAPPATSEHVIQSESATLSGGTGKASSHAGFTGTGYADYSGQNSAVTYSITRTGAGTGKLDFRYANGSSASRPLQVLVNNVVVGTISCAPTGGWTTWKTVSLSNVALPAGNVAIKVLASTSAGGANVDSLTITSNTTTPPVDPPPVDPPPVDPPPATDAEVTLQLESGVFTGGTGKSTSHAGYTGTGFADFAGQSSSTTVTLTRATAKAWKLTFRYANGSTANRPLQVFVNNALVGTIACAPTGGWTKWATVSLSNITLPAGTVTIKAVASTSAGGANVDSLAIATDSGTVTPPPPPPPPPTGNTGAVGGFLFFDSNKNAKFDTGEQYQAGKVVFIDLDGDNVLDSNEKKLTTDAQGKFNFTGLEAGTYKVRRVVPSGYKVTTPVTNITITAGQIFSTVAIGTATV